jgi:hypothetical protein
VGGFKNQAAQYAEIALYPMIPEICKTCNWFLEAAKFEFPHEILELPDRCWVRAIKVQDAFKLCQGNSFKERGSLAHNKEKKWINKKQKRPTAKPKMS